MSNRIRTVVVTLEADVSEEYVDRFLTPGILAMKGVLSVDKEVSDYTAHFAMENARHELTMKIYEVLKK